MITLDPDFLTIDPIDYEYKTYVILDYKQKILEQFKKHHLYPYINDISKHIITISNFLINKKIIDTSKMNITGIDISNDTLIYKSAIEDTLMDNIQEIAEYGLNHFREMIKIGKNLFDEVDKSLHIHEMGLKSLDKNEGILVTCNGKVFNIYHFNIHNTILDSELNLVLSLKLIESHKKTKEIYTKTIIKNIRKDYIDDIYYCIFDDIFPFEETIFPVLKRKLLKHISNSISIDRTFNQLPPHII